MSDYIHIRSISAIQSMRDGLAHARSSAQRILDDFIRDVSATCDWFHDRLRTWQGIVAGCRSHVAAATEQVRLSNSRVADLRSTGEAVARAQVELLTAKTRLGNAETELRNIQHVVAEVLAAIAAYRQQAQRMGIQLDKGIPQTLSMLDRKIIKLRHYEPGL